MISDAPMPSLPNGADCVNALSGGSDRERPFSSLKLLARSAIEP